MLNAITSGVILGIAISFLHFSESSTGGTLIIGKLFQKYLHTTNAVGIGIADIFITIGALIVFGLEIILYSILILAISTFIADYIETGTQRKKQSMLFQQKAMK